MPSLSELRPSLRLLVARAPDWFSLPLGAYALYHLWSLWPALSGRDAWLERTQATRLGRVAGLLVIVLVAAHAVRGALHLAASRKRAALSAAKPDSLLGFQAFTGALFALFLIVHLSQVWPSESGPHASWASGYDRLLTELGEPLLLCVYVVGVSALVFHLGVGLFRVLVTCLPRVPLRTLRALAFGFGLVLWLGYLQVAARFAIGEGLYPAFLPSLPSIGG